MPVGLMPYAQSYLIFLRKAIDLQQKSKISESPLKVLGGQPILDFRF